MGAKRGGGEERANESSMVPSLLFTTMCLIGLPVEVQVTDGSIFSGVFHTAHLELGYGVILRKARKIVRGKSETNIPLGAFVDTLVILSADLVQVDFVLPAEGIVSGVNRNEVETASEVLESGVCNEGLEQNFGKMVRKDILQEVLDSSEHNHELPAVDRLVHMEQCSTKVDACVSQATSSSENRVEISSKVPNESGSFIPRSGPSRREGSENNSLAVTNSPSSDCYNSTATSPYVSSVDSKLSSVPGQLESSNPPATTTNLVGYESVKEFKLNPEAKVFTPSSANARPATTERSTLANACYSEIPSVVPMAGTQPGAELNSFMSPPSMLTKFIQYNNLVAGPSNLGQYPGHIAANIRQPPVRFGSQHHPLQSGPTYVHPNSQSVMVSRLGQLAYVSPISRDVIQGTLALPQGLQHPLLTQYQAHPKFQGTSAQPLPLCVTPSPPLIASVNQPFLVPNQTHFSHPFPNVRSIPLPGANGIFVSKFH
ncbi:putative ataxin-2, ataxin 2, SM domain-containing protein [Dioscorea sansibarensis]